MKMKFHLAFDHLIPSSPFLIPYATHAKAGLLNVAGAANFGTGVPQFAVPSDVRINLCTTPPVTGVANEAVCPSAEAVTAREGCET